MTASKANPWRSQAESLRRSGRGLEGAQGAQQGLDSSGGLRSAEGVHWGWGGGGQKGLTWLMGLQKGLGGAWVGSGVSLGRARGGSGDLDRAGGAQWGLKGAQQS